MEKIAPFVSNSQRRKFYAMVADGTMSQDTLDEWNDATPKGKKLPEHVKKATLMSSINNLWSTDNSRLAAARWNMNKKAIDICFSKIAVQLKKLPPVPTHVIAQNEAMEAVAEKSKGLSPVAARVAKSPRLN